MSTVKDTYLGNMKDAVRDVQFLLKLTLVVRFCGVLTPPPHVPLIARRDGSVKLGLFSEIEGTSDLLWLYFGFVYAPKDRKYIQFFLISTFSPQILILN